MEGVNFQEDQFNTNKNLTAGKPSKMATMLLSTGLAKDQKQAQLLLMVSAIVFVAIAIAVPILFGNRAPSADSSDELSPKELAEIEALENLQ
jgi:hypothetical protein